MGIAVLLALIVLEILAWINKGFIFAVMLGIFYLALAVLYVRWARISRLSLFHDKDDADAVYSFIFPLDYGNKRWEGSEDQWLEVAIGWPFCVFCEILRILFFPFAFLGWIVSKLPKSETKST